MKELTNQTWTEAATQPVALVDFFSTTCPPCRLLKTILDPLSQEMKDKIPFFSFNVEQDSDGLCDQFNIEVVPTLVILKNGVEVARNEGVLPKPKLVAWIEENLA